MNINRNNNNNNRRRGRGSNNRQPGGQQLNRIDSRARGNAPQMLEKYRKLAQDSHLNGDRVTEEYYLQFADHYFRVIADQRARMEEQRQPRQIERSSENGDEYSEDDFYGDSNSPYDRAGNYAPSMQGGNQSTGQHQGNSQNFGQNPNQNYNPNQNAGQNSGQNSGHGAGHNPNQNSGQNTYAGNQGNGGYGGEQRSDRGRRPRDDRSDRPERGERQERRPRTVAPSPEAPQGDVRVNAAPAAAPQVAAEPSVYEPTENPFVRTDRAPRAPRGRKPRRDDDVPASTSVDSAPVTEQPVERASAETAPRAEPAANLDASMLPPAISRRDDAVEEAPVKPKRRTRRAAPPADDAAGTLETVN